MGLEECPECGYCLTGLPGPHRCPECGVPYDELSCVWRVESRSAASRRFLLAGMAIAIAAAGVLAGMTFFLWAPSGRWFGTVTLPIGLGFLLAFALPFLADMRSPRRKLFLLPDRLELREGRSKTRIEWGAFLGIEYPLGVPSLRAVGMAVSPTLTGVVAVDEVAELMALARRMQRRRLDKEARERDSVHEKPGGA
jgi:hypothetical protein